MVTAFHVWQTLQVEMMNLTAKRLLDEGKSKINCLLTLLGIGSQFYNVFPT